MNNIEDSLISIIAQGNKEGYKEEYKYDGNNNRMICNGYSFKPTELQIEGMRRLEGMRNPGDQMIYYKINSREGQKGYYIGAYGIEANEAAMNFLTEVEESDLCPK